MPLQLRLEAERLAHTPENLILVAVGIDRAQQAARLHALSHSVNVSLSWWGGKREIHRVAATCTTGIESCANVWKRFRIVTELSSDRPDERPAPRAKGRPRRLSRRVTRTA
eukprot:1380559-Prymnesium_polylepis.1